MIINNSNPYDILQNNPQLREIIPKIIEKLQFFFNLKVNNIIIDNIDKPNLQQLEKYIFSNKLKVESSLERIHNELDEILSSEVKGIEYLKLNKSKKIQVNFILGIQRILINNGLLGSSIGKIDKVIEFLKYTIKYFNYLEIVGKDKSENYDEIIGIKLLVGVLLKDILIKSEIINNKYIGYIPKTTMELLTRISGIIQNLVQESYEIKICNSYILIFEKLLIEEEKNGEKNGSNTLIQDIKQLGEYREIMLDLIKCYVENILSLEEFFNKKDGDILDYKNNIFYIKLIEIKNTIYRIEDIYKLLTSNKDILEREKHLKEIELLQINFSQQFSDLNNIYSVLFEIKNEEG